MISRCGCGGVNVFAEMDLRCAQIEPTLSSFPYGDRMLSSVLKSRAAGTLIRGRRGQRISPPALCEATAGEGDRFGGVFFWDRLPARRASRLFGEEMTGWKPIPRNVLASKWLSTGDDLKLADDLPVGHC